MNSFLQELTKIQMPRFSFLIEQLFQKPLAWLLAVVPTVAIVNVTEVIDFWGSVYFLIGFCFVDFVTGVLASYFIWKEIPNKEDKWFFGKGEGFSSDKFKKMFVKLIVYFGTPYVLQVFQEKFRLHNLKYTSISDAEFSIATILILVFCLNEGFSIFHENLPKCGFNIWDQIKRMIGFYKEAKKEIND